MDKDLKEKLREVQRASGRITVLTGAGISAESGIPTFRGPQGFWTVGSREYHPQEMATLRMFQRMPAEVWHWYLYRLGICRKARPNPGHLAVAEMESILGDKFILITQNVDGLHLQAGNTAERTYQIHGNISFMRCAAACSTKRYPLGSDIPVKARDEALSKKEQARLRCPNCSGWARPHVLWFDESYNEEHYRFESSMKAAMTTDMLIIAGSSGSTNLPGQVAATVKKKGGIVVDINIERNPFSELALSGGNGFFIQQPSGKALPEIVAAMK